MIKRAVRIFAAVLLAAIVLASLGADLIAPAPYAQQFRDHPNASPSKRFPLGTDDLGRDRLSRLLHGTRISLLLAPAAALAATIIAALAGIAAGMLGGKIEKALLSAIDLISSLPWLFLLIAVRALLPLNISAYASVAITFLLLGALGWTGAARVIRAAALSVRESGFLLQARALGLPVRRLWLIQLLPNLRAPVASQFWLSIPLFILAEANLGILGLGVTEPLPSLGNLLLDLANHRDFMTEPWRLAPVVLLLLVLLSLQSLSRFPAGSGGGMKI